jgi:SAM-dependent methyltransferase
MAMPDDGKYEPATFGDRFADVYDTWFRLPQDTVEAVERLAELAGRGPVLELGIGTGRLALPLQERGIPIYGIDASQAMVEKLRAKPGGDRIPVKLGDFADVPVEGEYTLVFVAFNTLFALPTQEEQVRCFTQAARRLRSGGRFLVQGFVPDPTRFERLQRVQALQVGVSEVMLEASRHDPVTQSVSSQHIVITGDGMRLYPVRIRYAWPSELDLMARIAGLELESRHAGWKGEPFDARSGQHVSIWRRP